MVPATAELAAKLDGVLERAGLSAASPHRRDAHRGTLIRDALACAS